MAAEPELLSPRQAELDPALELMAVPFPLLTRRVPEVFAQTRNVDRSYQECTSGFYIPVGLMSQGGGGFVKLREDLSSLWLLSSLLEDFLACIMKSR